MVKATSQQLQNQNEIPQSRHLAPTIDDIKIILWCCAWEYRTIKARPGERASQRGGISARKQSGLRLTDIDQEFQLLKYSSVSSIVTRTEKQPTKKSN